LKRGIGSPQISHHPSIESKMWERDSISSEDPKGYEIDPDKSPYLPEGGSVDLERDDDRGDGQETVGDSFVMPVRDIKVTHIVVL
jgi:hypothetical protein